MKKICFIFILIVFIFLLQFLFAQKAEALCFFDNSQCGCSNTCQAIACVQPAGSCGERQFCEKIGGVNTGRLCLSGDHYNDNHQCVEDQVCDCSNKDNPQNVCNKEKTFIGLCGSVVDPSGCPTPTPTPTPTPSCTGFLSCGACQPSDSCGWCFSSNQCKHGSSFGSDDGLCAGSNWGYFSCNVPTPTPVPPTPTLTPTPFNCSGFQSGLQFACFTGSCAFGWNSSVRNTDQGGTTCSAGQTCCWQTPLLTPTPTPTPTPTGIPPTP